jgi:hypothetical protein
MQRKSFDVPIGRVLSVAALGFGVTGLGAGLRNSAYASSWYFAAIVLGVSSGAILVDELRRRNVPEEGNLDAWLGTLALLCALATGTVGFILGLMDGAHATTWSMAAVALAILALGAMANDLRQLHGSEVDMTSVYALSLASVGASLCILGFALGLLDRPYSQALLWGAVVSSIIAATAQFGVEHRAALPEQRYGVRGQKRPEDAGTVTRS